MRAEAVQIDDRRLLLLLRRCLTKKHRDGDAQHMLSKKLIEEGDGLPDMMSTTHCDDSLVKVGVQIVETPPLSSPSNPLFLPPTKVGFQVVETRDAALDPNPGGEAWYVILTPSFFNLFRLQFTVLGYYIVNAVLTFMEMIRLAPKGSGKVRVRVRVRDRVKVRVRVSDPPRAQGQRQG